MQDTRELIGMLNQGARPLSKGHRRIAEYIAQHYDKAVFMTAGALGRECGVSESTVVRFASAMGYEGYPELRERLRGLVSQRLTSEPALRHYLRHRAGGCAGHRAQKRRAQHP